MVDYVEKATLKIIDEATPSLLRINDALQSLNRSFSAIEKLQPFTNFNRQADNLASRIDAIHKTTQQRAHQSASLNVAQSSKPPSVFKLDISPLKVWSAGFLAHMGSTFESALVRGIREGATQQYVAQSRLDNLPINKNDRRFIDRNVRSIRDQTGGIFNTTDIKEEFADIYSITHNVKSTLSLLPDILQFARTSIATTGVSKNEGLATSRNIIKALDVISRLITNSQGAFTDDKDKYLKAITDSYLVSGKFITSGQITTIIRNLRSTGKTLDPEAFKYLLLQAESEGTRIGNTMNRLVTGIAGNATKRAQDNLVRFGLGYRDSNLEYHPIDEDRLRNNPYSWISKHFREGFANFYGLDAKKEGRTVDALLGNRAKMGSFIHAITSSRIAADEFTAIVTDMVQLRKRLALVNSLPNQRERSARDDRNALLQLEGTLSAFEQVLGTASKAILDNLITPLTSVKNLLYKADDFINGGDNSGGSRLARSALVFGGAATIGAAGFGIAKNVAGNVFGFSVFKKGSDTLLVASTRLLAAANGLIVGKGGLGAAANEAGIMTTPLKEEANQLRKLPLLERLARSVPLWGKVGRFFTGVGPLAADVALNYADQRLTAPALNDTAAQRNRKKDIHALFDISESAIEWGGAGALAGSIIPLIGTSVGGVTGAIAGTAYAGYQHAAELKDIWDAITSRILEATTGTGGADNHSKVVEDNTLANRQLTSAIMALLDAITGTQTNNLPSDQRREATGATAT